MPERRFAERKPVIFSFLLLVMLIFIQGAGVAAAQISQLPARTFSVYTVLALSVALVILVSVLRWWGEIGFRWTGSRRDLWLYAPGLALFVGNLTFGIQPYPLTAVALFLVLAAGSGFVEEVIFRGLMLRAFLPRGVWTAVLASTAFFGFTHAFNVLAGEDILYTLLQICYALAIGFCFAAMALRGRMVWPLAILHGLGNFAAFLNTDPSSGNQATPYVMVVIALYIVLFTGYGWYLMRRRQPSASPVVPTPVS